MRVKNDTAKPKLTGTKIRSLFTGQEWSEMIDLMRKSLDIAPSSPALAYFTQRQIINRYARHTLGNRAESVLDVLCREVRDGNQTKT